MRPSAASRSSSSQSRPSRPSQMTGARPPGARRVRCAASDVSTVSTTAAGVAAGAEADGFSVPLPQDSAPSRQRPADEAGDRDPSGAHDVLTAPPPRRPAAARATGRRSAGPARAPGSGGRGRSRRPCARGRPGRARAHSASAGPAWAARSGESVASAFRQSFCLKSQQRERPMDRFAVGIQRATPRSRTSRSCRGLALHVVGERPVEERALRIRVPGGDRLEEPVDRLPVLAAGRAGAPRG